jgi:hypothetical protein
MARGQDSGAHPGRQVGRERWTPTTAITGPMGQVTMHAHGLGQAEPYLSSWKGPGGHTAGVEHWTPAYGGVEQNNYTAGPFRTQQRSIIAAEALSNRALNRPESAERYKRSSYYHTPAELKYYASE